MNATEKLEMINNALASGKTVYAATCTRVTKVTPKTAAKFEAINRPVFKVVNDSLYITAGNRYVCADHVALSVSA